MLKQTLKSHITRAWTPLLALAAIGVVGPAFAAAPLECNTSSELPFAKGTGRWTVTALGPFAVECLGTGGECTRMDYTVEGGFPDHVVVLVSADVEVVDPDDRNVSAPCERDTTTSIGGACNLQAVRLNSAPNKVDFSLIVRGHQVAMDSSVSIKKGSKLESCRI